MLDPVRNFGKVLVSTGYDHLATAVDLATGDGAKLPEPGVGGDTAFNLVWWNNSDYADPADDPNREIVRCTARTTDTITVTRAQEGTVATAKNIPGKTYRMILAMTKKAVDDINAHIAAAAAHHAVHVKTLADHPEAIIDAAIARDTEVDSKITTHAGNVNVHHAQLHNAPSHTDITSPGADIEDAVVKRLLLQDVVSPYVVSGLTATITGTDANVTIAAGIAYNIQRLETTANTVLTVTNTGVAHTEYVSVNTAGALIITTVARAADDLAVADVSVSATGVATAVTDVRQLKLHLKTAGAERVTVDKDGNVGIGTMWPTAKLMVRDDTVGYTAIFDSIGGRGAAIAWTKSGTIIGACGTSGVVKGNIEENTYLLAETGHQLEFMTNGLVVPKVIIDTTGNVGIQTTNATNILTFPAGSATDPIADSWLVHSLRAGKKILPTAVSPLADLKTTAVRQWQRKLSKPLLKDMKDELDESGEVGRTKKERWEDEIEEYKRKKKLPKFTRKNYGLVAEEAPAFVQAHDDKGNLQGVDLGAYVGWLHACVKSLSEKIEVLEKNGQSNPRIPTR